MQVDTTTLAAVNKKFGHVEQKIHAVMRSALESHLSKALVMAESTAIEWVGGQTNSLEERLVQPWRPD